MNARLYKRGSIREQGQLLPPCVEDYVTPSNPVRAIEAYVESLDLEELGFTNSQGGISKGQPAYCPSDLLKLYLYGYLNRIRSSRRLEQETYRNLEVMWLLRGLHPCYKTIADFRKNNLVAIQLVNKDFVLLCKELDLYGGELVGIDGSFFIGNAGKGSIYTANRIKKQLERIEADISHYLQEMEDNDREPQGEAGEDAHLREKLAKLQERQKGCQDKLNQLKESGQTQLSSTDADARLLSKRGQTIAGYNVQSAVDDKHKLLVDCEVVNDGNDMQQLFPMAKKAKEILEAERLEVVADSGYYSQSHLKDCHEEGITPYVPIPNKSSSSSMTGRFGRQDFKFDEERDAYQCPAGKYLEKQSRQRKGGKDIFKYKSKSIACKGCQLRKKCLPEKTPYRQIYRYEHEEVIEAHQKRMRQKGRTYMKKRASLVEHPFGTFKLWCGWTHFLMKGLKKVRAEMSLLMLSYNFKRVLNIIGMDTFREYCLQRRSRVSVQDTDYSDLILLFIHWMAMIYLHLNRFKTNLRQKKTPRLGIRGRVTRLSFGTT
ncbi:MAG: IS1182 family transposase [bacterium]